MVGRTARERMANGRPPVIAELEGRKADRYRARTMLIPSAEQVAESIAAIPRGETRTIRELRAEMAARAGADVTCPAAASRLWRLVAQAVEEERLEGAAPPVPWWRVTRDGRPHKNLPGGEERQRALLQAEGVAI